MIEAKMNVSELARALAGKNATHKQIENQRTTIYRWKRGAGISNEKAERLAEILDKPLDYFKKPEPDPSELDRLRRLAKELIREVEAIERRMSQGERVPGGKS